MQRGKRRPVEGVRWATTLTISFSFTLTAVSGTAVNVIESENVNELFRTFAL
jgi:hypothetical protein